MRLKAFRSDLLLLLTAMIWGFAFVAQRSGMEYIGPFWFNACRFLLGGVSLIPFLIWQKKRKPFRHLRTQAERKTFWRGAFLAGFVLFVASSFQQIGIVYTTAGNAGFITGLYVIIVPLLGLFIRHRVGRFTWLGACFAVIGLYVLSVHGKMQMAFGDGLVFVSALFWALHVHIIGYLTLRVPAILLACAQFLVSALLSLAAALIWETFCWHAIIAAYSQILYAGLFSVGIAYTLQVLAQRSAPPAHVAIILSLESVFAVIGGTLFLQEPLTFRIFIGCGLMFCGMWFAQFSRNEG